MHVSREEERREKSSFVLFACLKVHYLPSNTEIYIDIVKVKKTIRDICLIVSIHSKDIIYMVAQKKSKNNIKNFEDINKFISILYNKILSIIYV